MVAQATVIGRSFNLSLQAKRRIQSQASGCNSDAKNRAMLKPPPLPSEVIARVVRISGIDGFTLVFIAGGFGLISASAGDWLGALVGGLAAGAGLIELHGRRRLKKGDLTGVKWLVRSQLVLLTIILLYVAYQLHGFDVQPLLVRVETSLASVQRSSGMEVISLADMVGLTNKQFLELARRLVTIVYIAVGLGTILCQGGLAFYYHRREQAVAKALRKI